MTTLYWITVLGNISDLAGLAFCMFAAFCFFTSFDVFADNFGLDCSKTNKKTFKVCFIGVLVSLTLCILIPSKNELYAIYGIGSVIDYAKSNKEVQKLPDNAVKALNIYLESIQNKDSTNITKR